MNTTPQKRVLKRVLLESLHRYRQFGDLPEDMFSEAMEDYPVYLRTMAEIYEKAPPELKVQEKPGFEGYTDWAETYDSETNNQVIQGEDLVFGQLMAPLRKTTVLDVGAGTGRHAIPLARAGSRVTAVEPNAEMRSRAKAKAKASGLDIEFLSGDAYHPLEDARVFDLVICCLVFSHVENLGRAFAALAAHVKPDGHLIVTDFHPINLLVGMRTSYSYKGVKFYVPNTIHLPSEYIELAKDEGLQLLAFHECGNIEGYARWPATLVLAFQR